MEGDAAFFGIVLPKPAEPESFDVWPENWPALMLYLRCSTQWRTAGMSGQRLGLDYPAVLAMADLHGCRDADTMDKIGTIEREILNSVRAKDDGKR